MKNYPSVMKQLIFVSLTIILIYACNQPKDKITIEYRIVGENWIVNSNDSITKIQNIHFRNDKIIVDRTILNNPDLVTSINWKDSRSTRNIENGDLTELNQSILISTLKTDTFYVYEENEDIKYYIVSGKTESKYLTISQESDSLHYLVNGTFIDTIQIKNEKGIYAEKMAYNIIHKTLYEIIHEEIKKEVEKIYHHYEQ
jgi:hypothetical protein